jgi:hypothetical protein
MEFRIADTFTDSLARLTGEEQKAVKTTAFDLQLNPAQPGLQFHKLDKPRDPNFSSVRVSRDIRLIVHRTPSSLLLCYVAHHDKAYQWAERRRLETHPKTGAAQFVEIREMVQEIVIPQYVQEKVEAPRKPPLFASMTDEQLLGYGVPGEWLNDVRQADEDTVLALADHLPAEAAEALLEIATGGTPILATPPEAGADPFAHPDAQRRFRILKNVEELERALEYPWEKWTVFLHPAQRELTLKIGGAPCPFSMDRRRSFAFAETTKKKPVLLGSGCQVWCKRVCCHTNARCSSGPMRNSIVHALRPRLQVFRLRFSMQMWRLRVGTSPSARCIWRKVSSSGQSP